MSFGAVTFLPLLAWPVLIGLAAIAAAITIFALLRRARGGWWRSLGFLLLLATLAGPRLKAQTTTPLPDIAVVVVDHSQSMRLADRAAQAATALASLTATAGRTQLRVVDIPATAAGGTALFTALRAALANIPPAQLAGTVAITDGEVSDPTAAPSSATPFTALLTAKGDQTDRELRLLDAPAYGLVGQPVTLKLIVIDHGTTGTNAPATVTVTANGVRIVTEDVKPGQPVPVKLPVSHAGPAIIAAAVTPLSGEISRINNQAAFTLNGIQRRLNILLISGSPDQGERSWRLLLKSDPAVQLVHFTILRTLGEAIDADIDDLALVPFPVHQLFESDLGKFDLVIMDRFDPMGLLPPAYLGNLAAYVQNGGALLAELGPEFASADSLAFTPLNAVLPAAPADPGIITQPFNPAVTGLGERHPVTAPLAGAIMAPWYRLDAAAPSQGDVLMSGADHVPLLILADVAKGRVGMLLSDQFWLWTRGGTHSGPALPLLRRIVHWLLREPALEAESLTAAAQGDQLLVTRQTVSANNPGDAVVTAPDGRTTRLALRQIAPGRYAGTVPDAQQSGVWQITEGNLTAYAAANAVNSQEFQDLAATSEIMAPLSRNLIWLGQTPKPALPPLLTPRHAVRVTGAHDIPLLPPLPAMLVAMALLFGAWWREAD